MKRQKRAPTDRALARGYQAGCAGKSRDQCPHESGKARHMWIAGWREGREDHWNGFNTAAHMERLQNM